MQLRDQIGFNEKVLWEGTKDKRVTVFESIFNPLLFFALIWAVFDTSIMVLTFNDADMAVNRGVMTGILLFLAVHMMPVWIYIGGVITSALRAKHTYYLITDKAVYIQSGIFNTVTEVKPFTDLSHINIHTGIFDKVFGTGDVILVCSHISMTAGYQNDTHTHGMNIENIRDYEEVFRIVKNQQEIVYADTMYPNNKR